MHRSAQVALLALMTGIGIALSPVAAQTNPPAPPAPPAAPVQSQCAAVPALPPMPDGSSANRAAMDAYNATYTQWTSSAQAAMACRRAEATALRTRAAPLVEEFNTAQARVNAINAYWTAWVNHINGQAQPGATERSSDIVNGEFRGRNNADAASTVAPPADALPDVSTLGTGPLTPANSTSQCGAIPEPAHPPDAEHLSASQLRSRVPPAVTAYNAWLQDAQAKLVCRHDEAHNFGGQADALINEYNTSSQLVASSSAQWRAEADEFNARGAHH